MQWKERALRRKWISIKRTETILPLVPLYLFLFNRCYGFAFSKHITLVKAHHWLLVKFWQSSQRHLHSYQMIILLLKANIHSFTGIFIWLCKNIFLSDLSAAKLTRLQWQMIYLALQKGIPTCFLGWFSFLSLKDETKTHYLSRKVMRQPQCLEKNLIPPECFCLFVWLLLGKEEDISRK